MASNGNNTRAQGSNWRALGDIGNLVGALSQRCIVSKDGLLLKNPIAAAKQQLDRPITRQYVALNSQQFALKSSATAQAQKDRGDEAKNVACGAAKHRRTSRGRDPVSDVPSNVTTEATSAATTTSSFEPMSEDGQRNSTQKQHSLTAMLRARSEVTTACAGFEVEMEEADDFFHNVVDIDEADVGNQLAVVDYIEDLTAFYRKTEMQSCVAQDYMSRQADINEKMRAILIDWLIEVHLKFKLMPETLFLAINLIDRFLASECSVLRKELQLVGVTAMLIACKYEEIWAPEVQDFVFISDNAYTRNQVLAMEKTMLNRLKFNLTVPTPYVFLVRFLKAASPSSSSSSSDTQRDLLALFLVELCLTEYSMLCYSPSMVAAAAVYTAHRTLHTLPFWTPTLQHHTGYQELQLRECSNKMVEFHNNAGKGKLLVVHNKYSTHKFSSVATLDPFSISSQP